MAADIVLTPQILVDTGAAPTFTGSLATGTLPSTGQCYQFPNDGRTWIEVKNGGGTACNVSIETDYTVDGMALADRTVQVPITTGDRIIGPFPKGVYNPNRSYVRIAFDFITSVTIGVFTLP